MILDKQTLLSNAQAITADAASENIYNTGSAADAGAGASLKVFAVVDTTFDNLTSMNIILQSHDDDAFGAQRTHWSVPVLLAGLTAGTKLQLPDVPANCQQYLRLYYDVVGTNPSAGAITAGFILEDQVNTPTTD